MMRSSVVKTVKQLQQMKSTPSESALLTDSKGIIINKGGDGEDGKKGNRNSSAETEATKPKVHPESQGTNRKNKFQIGVPSNYDKMKSIRELKSKDKGVTKLYQAPDPTGNDNSNDSGI